MKPFTATCLALLCLAPMAQAHGHFRGGYGGLRGGYGYGFAPAYNYSLFTPYIPVQAVYTVAPVVQLAAPVVEAAPYCPPAALVPTYSSGFSGYAGSYGYGPAYYGRRFHRPPVAKPAPKVLRRR